MGLAEESGKLWQLKERFPPRQQTISNFDLTFASDKEPWF